MSGNVLDLIRKKGLDAEAISPRHIKTTNVYETSVDVSKDIEIEINKDHFVHFILLELELGDLTGGTTPAWTSTAGDDILTDVTLFADGNKYFKVYNWKAMRQVCIANREKPSDGSATAGYNKVYFSDPRIPEAQPLPAWIFTSLTLKIKRVALSSVTTGSPTGATCNLKITLFESMYRGENLDNWRVLIEKIPRWKKYGTDTLEQEYEMERANMIFDLLLIMDDNGTLSDSVFDRLSLKGRTKEGEIVFLNDLRVTSIKEQNKSEFLNSLDTGYLMLQFANGLPTYRYTSLKAYPNIPTAGTNIGLRVLERYIL